VKLFAQRAPGLAACMLLSIVAPLGCAAGSDVAARLANASLPSHMPLVQACWEKQFEAASFTGEYTATVSFVVTKGTSAIRGARVVALEATDKHDAQDVSAFRACLKDALDHTALSTSDDSNGPGFATSSDLQVKGYVIAFVDASSKQRQEAATRAAHVLLGPRADRCQGLYTYDPPREEVDLFTAAGEADDAAAAQAKADPDQYARTLQKAYDLRLELRERLRLELSSMELPDANRKKLTSAIEETEARARAIGAAIGCKAP